MGTQISQLMKQLSLLTSNLSPSALNVPAVLRGFLDTDNRITTNDSPVSSYPSPAIRLHNRLREWRGEKAANNHQSSFTSPFSSPLKVRIQSLFGTSNNPSLSSAPSDDEPASEVSQLVHHTRGVSWGDVQLWFSCFLTTTLPLWSHHQPTPWLCLTITHTLQCVSLTQRSHWRDTLKSLLAAGIICASSSPLGAGFFFDAKKA